jgi:hypothetical protein
MSPVEVLHHLRRQAQLRLDRQRALQRSSVTLTLDPAISFPPLPAPGRAPGTLRDALRDDARRILDGRWMAFGHLELQVHDPPRWHRDYLAGRDMDCRTPPWKLNHRQLPDGADIKLVWELSRWTQLTRLAMAAHVLGEPDAALRCVRWLADWDQANPTLQGWNWTSALEGGIRLIQLAWIDALLAAVPGGAAAHHALRSLLPQLLPPHVQFVWHGRSFGSSANNHWLGELAGLVIAIGRWPALTRWAIPLQELQSHWEREVLRQFNEDGGNREQALHYHLFSWELCWQTRLALLAAGRSIRPEVEQRLAAAAHFFRQVHPGRDSWDYGDSDSAHVTPVFLRETSAVQEWHHWLCGATGGEAISYWLDAPPAAGRCRVPARSTGPGPRQLAADWQYFPQTGIAVCVSQPWRLRWDLSPLGYLKPAAHGHLDALHLSMWYEGTAILIDPGTGAYYGDPALRAWLASRPAHNGPCPAGPDVPRRLGPFLWSQHHPQPALRVAGTERHEGILRADLRLPSGLLRRSLERRREPDGWRIIDELKPEPPGVTSFSVCWQFAPGTVIEPRADHQFHLRCGQAAIDIELGDSWSRVELVTARPSSRRAGEAASPGTVSSAFRQEGWAPYLRLEAGVGDKPCVFSTSFLACVHK